VTLVLGLSQCLNKVAQDSCEQALPESRVANAMMADNQRFGVGHRMPDTKSLGQFLEEVMRDPRTATRLILNFASS
jgi:hypothetical protein